jgi:serine/threonine-protein kinase HipA
MSELNVFLGTQFVGTIEAVDGGDAVAFEYARGDGPALSLSMPRQQRRVDPDRATPFFQNLLPEGQALQKLLAGRRSAATLFLLLRDYGPEAPGAVRILAPDVPPERPADYEPIAPADLPQFLADIRRTPITGGSPKVRLSLAGVQEKTGVLERDGTLYRCLNGSPSTHILKVAREDVFPRLPQNEAFCMAVAEAVGIETAEAGLRWAGKTPFLLVRRYDRRLEGARVMTIHQEDFAQALGVPPAEKYERDDDGRVIGPGLADCVEHVLKQARAPIIDIRDFARRVMLNHLLGNADAHAKNFSLLYDEPGRAPRLAPAYDLVSTAIYPQLSRQMAMAMAGTTDPGAVTLAGFVAAATLGGTPRPSIARRTIAELAAAVREAARHLSRGRFDAHPPYYSIRQMIDARIRHINEACGLDIAEDLPDFEAKGGGWQLPS